MSEVSREVVIAALQGVADPASGNDIVSAGLVAGLVIRGPNLGFALNVGGLDEAQRAPLQQAAEAAARAIPGVASATVVLTAERAPAPPAPAAEAQPAPQPVSEAAPAQAAAEEPAAEVSTEASEASEASEAGEAVPAETAAVPATAEAAVEAPAETAAQPAAQEAPPTLQTGPQPPKPEPVPGVKWIIAVASGKGGVGKSTIAANLAIALKQCGLRVGLLDADIYGPSMPRMLGVNVKPKTEGGKIIPLTAFGLKVMSMGFLIEEDKPMIWRGPMVSGAVQQLFREVDWGELDVLVVDMPPGTGDAQLTLSQRIAVTGAIIVSTPQDIALLDAKKGLQMFRKVDVPILGIIENMSGFHCPHCGERTNVFGHGGAHDTADEFSCDFLGDVPLSISIREASDAGDPVASSMQDATQGKLFRAIAEKVKAKLEEIG